MSEAVSALKGASFDGIVTVEEMGLQGMITVRGDLASPEMKKAVKDATGLNVPEQGHIAGDGGNWVAWMSPDELLLVVAYDSVRDTEASLRDALSKVHHLAVNVSDARAMFRLSGNGALVREAIAKLCPVDMRTEAFAPGQFRRSRMAQVPAAIWMPDESSVQIVCFRSVAEYAFNLLKGAAAPGSEVGLFS